ncbi:MAG: hypothetical protein QOG89_3245, partial [Thermomicrobiales bacterium]|nr:hypothetical protein [Thermomicrobiales bacterium]
MATPAVAVHTTTVASPSAGRVARLSRWVRRNPVTAFGFAIVLGLALLG